MFYEITCISVLSNGCSFLFCVIAKESLSHTRVLFLFSLPSGFVSFFFLSYPNKKRDNIYWAGVLLDSLTHTCFIFV
jgi:hypothetical protein